MLLSRLGIVTLVRDEGQNGHSGTVAAGDSPRRNIAVSPGQTVGSFSSRDFNLREPQAQRDDEHRREVGNGAGPGIDAHETGQKGQVKRG